MLGDTLLEIMQQQGIYIHQNHKAQTINLHSDGKKTIVCQSGAIIYDIDVIISAVGRKPRTGNLNLANIQVQTDPAGLILVDKFQNTQ